MRWVEHVADELPAPRKDEPESLRQDIADEMADHLQCALSQELHFTPDEAEAKHNVLGRFGNVQAVARQLWLNAMQEKIMSQRLTMLMSAVLVATCLTACGLMWKMIGQTNDIVTQTTEAYNTLVATSKQSNEDLLAQQKAANNALIEQNRVSNQALLDQLERVSAPAQPKSLEWNGVKLRVAADDENGPPLEGVEAMLYRRSDSDPPQTVLVTKTSGADGMIDFGLRRTGNYSLYLTTPWQETLELTITVKPGQELMKTVVAPPSPPEKHALTLKVEWPDDLRDKKLWVVADVNQDFRSFKQWRETPVMWTGSSWRSTFGPSASSRFSSRRGSSDRTNIASRVIIDITGQFAEHRGDFRAYKPTDQIGGSFTRGRNDIFFRERDQNSRFQPSSAQDQGPTKYRTVNFLIGNEELNFNRQLQWTGTKFRLVNLAVALPARNAEDRPEIQSLEMLGAYFSEGIDYRGRSDPSRNSMQALFARGNSRADIERLIEERKQKQEELRNSLEFTPQAGEDNVWVITLPNELLELVRGNLKRMEEKTET
ncbi:MAG: prealbumin-like fold domain-containing protein [Planctomycetaceae bacterium]|nr:prealbumin-like fold domain-containing protein [Planctomycetaceae bacterium]